MKLYNIKNIFLGSVIALSLTGCNDALTEHPQGTISAEEFLITSNGYENMVKAVYEPVRWVTRNKTPYFLGTDMFTSCGRGLDYDVVKPADPENYSRTYLRGFNEWYKTSCDANNGDFSSVFVDAYCLIQRANNAIDYGMRADISSELRAQRIGELKFLRDLCYYWLVEQFSDVPLLVEAVKSPHFSVERTPEKEIYEFLIKDLEEAVDGVASKNAQPDFGRVTKGAIKMLLAKLYLTRAYKSYAEAGDAEKAYRLALDIIDNEGYELIDYEALFEEGNEINNEIIFSVQYSTNEQVNWGGNNDYAVFQPFLYAIPGFGSKAEFVERYTGSYAPTDAAYLLYDRSWDKRFDATFQREYFANENKSSDEGAFGRIKIGQKMFHFIFPGETPMTREEKDECDYFVVNFGEYRDHALVGGKKDDDGDYRVNGYAFDANGDPMKAQYWVYPGIRKFRDSKARYNDGSEKGTRDHFLFRLGEVYLIAAEASWKGNVGDGARYLQLLRNRAAYSGSAPALELTLDNILDERARELMGEERRFLELRRTGMIRERVITRRMNERAARALDVDPDMAFKDEYTTRPLPYNWTQYLQTAVEQNPGYDF